MKTQLIATAALLAALTATSANAITHKSGVIKSVDLESNTVVLALNGGRLQEYRLTADSRVVIDGKQSTVKSLAPLQEVTVAVPSSTAPKYIRATILEVDQATGLAVVKPNGSREAISIQLDESTKISGKISSKEELSEGQTIKIRYVANI